MRKFKHFNFLLIVVPTIIWCGFLAFLPFVEEWGGGYQTLKRCAYSCFSTVCHQQPDRSFLIHGAHMAVCARCAGIYFGFLGGLVFQPLLRPFLDRCMKQERWWLAGFIPMGVEFIFSHVGIITSGNLIRMWTGVSAGISSAMLLLPQWMEIAFKK